MGLKVLKYALLGRENTFYLCINCTCNKKLFREGSKYANGVTRYVYRYAGSIKAKQSECRKEGVKH